MKILLDTHALMWWHSEPQRIPENTLTLLQNPDHDLLVSLVSLWEMQIKIQLGKLILNDSIENMINIQQECNNIHLISINLEHILKLNDLPNHHKDPFDRILIAQSQVENAAIISRDQVFHKYDCSIIW
jgi:PIN domain nuclease of toxin-antitoxin system